MIYLPRVSDPFALSIATLPFQLTIPMSNLVTEFSRLHSLLEQLIYLPQAAASGFREQKEAVVDPIDPEDGVGFPHNIAECRRDEGGKSKVKNLSTT